MTLTTSIDGALPKQTDNTARRFLAHRAQRQERQQGRGPSHDQNVAAPLPHGFENKGLPMVSEKKKSSAICNCAVTPIPFPVARVAGNCASTANSHPSPA